MTFIAVLAPLDRSPCISRSVLLRHELSRADLREPNGCATGLDLQLDFIYEAGHQREQLDEKIAAAMTLEVAHAPIEAGEVCARTECPVAGPRQHHDADLGFTLSPPKRIDEIPEHDGRERVALVRAVEHDCGDVTVDRKRHLLERWSFSQRGNRRPPAR